MMDKPVMPRPSTSKRNKSGRPKSYIGSACDQCFRTKVRCDSAMPTCAQCSKSKRQCTYSTMKKATTSTTHSPSPKHRANSNTARLGSEERLNMESFGGLDSQSFKSEEMEFSSMRGHHDHPGEHSVSSSYSSVPDYIFTAPLTPKNLVIGQQGTSTNVAFNGAKFSVPYRSDESPTLNTISQQYAAFRPGAAGVDLSTSSSQHHVGSSGGSTGSNDYSMDGNHPYLSQTHQTMPTRTPGVGYNRPQTRLTQLIYELHSLQADPLSGGVDKTLIYARQGLSIVHHWLDLEFGAGTNSIALMLASTQILHLVLSIYHSLRYHAALNANPGFSGDAMNSHANNGFGLGVGQGEYCSSITQSGDGQASSSMWEMVIGREMCAASDAARRVEEALVEHKMSLREQQKPQREDRSGSGETSADNMGASVASAFVDSLRLLTVQME